MKRILFPAVAAAVFCIAAPAAAGIEPTHDHLECFKIADPHAYSATVNITPEIGNNMGLDPHDGCTIKIRSKEFCVPVAKTVVTTDAPTIPVIGPDIGPGFLCYKMKCPVEATGSLNVGDQFGNRMVTPSKVTRICTPADW